MCGLESFSLHRGVGDKAEVHFVACGDQMLGNLAATQSTQNGCLVTVSVEGLQVVVRTFLVLLNLKLIKGLEKQTMCERLLLIGSWMGGKKDQEENMNNFKNMN